AVEPRLKKNGRTRTVDAQAGPFGVAAGLVKSSLSLHGRQALVDKFNRQSNSCGQFFGKLPTLARGQTFTAIEGKRQAHENEFNALIGKQLLEKSEGPLGRAGRNKGARMR